MRDKEKLAEFLFDEIGEIDDSIIASAENFRPRRSALLFKKLTVAAIAAALSVTVVLTAFIGNLQKSDGDDLDNVQNSADNDDGSNAPADSSPSDSDDSSEPEVITLASRLSSMKSENSADRLSAGEIKFLDGKARLIWKFSDEEFYRVCTISKSQLWDIESAIEKNEGTAPTSDSYQNKLDGFWIALGDGKVISPFLYYSPGNVGYNQLFSYDAEIEPSEVLTNYICDIIERN